MPDAADPTAVAAALGGSDAQLLGSGGFGDTYRVDGVPGHSLPVAVKLLKTGYDERRAQRESEGMARFSGDGVAALHDVRTVEVEGVARVALICEFIGGGDVQTRVGAGELPTPEQLHLFAVCLIETVADLHAANTYHRDIKPLNVLLRNGDWTRPVLIDFGYARLVTDLTITALGQHTGTYAYMPPEHLNGEPARKAADLWAVGVTLQVLATGSHPFLPDDVRSLTLEDLLILITSSPKPLPDDVDPRVAPVINNFLSELAYERGTAKRALKTLTETDH